MLTKRSDISSRRATKLHAFGKQLDSAHGGSLYRPHACHTPYFHIVRRKLASLVTCRPRLAREVE